MIRVASAVLCVVAPLAAYADSDPDYLKVEYAGTVTSTEGTGDGYSVGQRVGGTLFVDLRIAPPNRVAVPDSGTGAYLNRGTNLDFIRGFAPNLALKQDSVLVWDGDAPSPYAPDADGFAIGESSRDDFPRNEGAYSQTSKGVSVRAGYPSSDRGLPDFVQGDGIVQNFELSGDDVGTGTIGTTIRKYFNFDEFDMISNLAHFVLQKVSVSPGVCRR